VCGAYFFGRKKKALCQKSSMEDPDRDLEGDVRSSLRSSGPGFADIPPYHDAEAMKKYRAMAEDDAWKYFRFYVEATWNVIRCPPETGVDEHAMALFRGDDESPTLELMRENPAEQLVAIHQRYERLQLKLTELRVVMEHCNLFYSISRDYVERPHERSGEIQRVSQPPSDIQNEVGRWYNLIADHLRGYRLRLEELTHMLWRERPDAMQTREQHKDLMVVCLPPYVPKDDYELVLRYVCSEAHKAGYQRHGEHCFAEKVIHVEEESDKRGRFGVPIMVHKIHRTCAWEQVEEQSAFIYRVCDRRYSELMWSKLHSSGSSQYMVRMIQFFASGYDPEFPKLDRKKMRGVYSFENGIYFARTDTFYPWGEVPLGTASCKYINRPLPLEDGHLRRRRLPGENALVDMAWARIPTPSAQQIFEAQGLDEEVCCWIYVFLGRLLYAVGDKDRWQIMPFLKGVAGSGKSTLGMLVKMFYDPSDVGILANNVQKQFALADLYDKLVILCFEVKHNLQLDQAQFQCLVSGERVSVVRKYKVPLTIEWDVPMLFMGNEFFGANALGSLSRRTALIKFDHKPPNSDPDLLQKLADELPQILLKVNQAYLSAVELFGKRDIWDALPVYFQQTKADMKEGTSPFVSYLNKCSALLWDEEFFVPLDAVSAHFRNFCRNGGWPAESSKWTEDLYKQAFEEHVPSIRLETKAECQVDGRTLHNVLVAVGFKIDDAFA
jgi:hypothetical protein